VEDDGRILSLVKWSGTSAVLSTLELVIHNLGCVLEELEDMLQRIDAGVIPNLDDDHG